VSDATGGTSAVVLEATTDLDGDVPLRVTVRFGEATYLAGGPLNVEWKAWTTEGSAFVVLAGDRARRRFARMSFAARLEGSKTRLEDPAHAPPDLEFGGPAGAVSISEDTPVAIPVFVNQFLTLERTVSALPSGGHDTLVLDCRWDLTVSRQQADLLSRPATASAQLTLRLPVERDDAGLQRLVTEQARSVLASQVLDGEALGRLAELRYPGAAAIVTGLGGDHDRVASVLEALSR
jgi:hypothetical protein